MPRSTTELLVGRVLEVAPALTPAFDEHVEFYDGLLPHVFFGDVTRFVVEAFARGPGGPRGEAERVLQILEEAAAAGDSGVVELISASFLENLDQSAPAYREIRSAMGPVLRRELAHHEEQ